MKNETTTFSGFKDWLCNYSRFASEKGTVMKDFVIDVRNDDEYPRIELTDTNALYLAYMEHERLDRYFKYQANRHFNPMVYRCFVKAWREYLKEVMTCRKK